ncbi:MAG: hypothetical protein IJP31_11070 [Lachnospiraceae bacterium]|nr:hypothetical protein [Lachnospiraceae bacterium]
MDDLIILGSVFAVFIGAICIGLNEGRKRQRTLVRTLKENYGKANLRKWKTEDLERISYYSKSQDRIKDGSNADAGRAKIRIDDLTWADLGMDDLFCQMAYTGSSVGDDYLYYLLHHPAGSGMELERLEEKIAYYQENAGERLKLQVLFHEMGRLQNYSLSRYIQFMEDMEPGKNFRHHAANGLLLLSLLLMTVRTGPGFGLFLLCLCYNFLSYFRYKREMEPCLASFRYILTLLKNAEKIAGALTPVWKKEQEKLKEELKQFNRFRKNSYLLGSGGGAGGQEMEILLDYLRMCFHLDIIKFNSMLDELQQKADSLWELYSLLGELDSCLAIGAYRAWLPGWCIPDFTEKKELILEEGYHPLVEDAVPNSLVMDKNVLLTGSNASGKSTFLKTMGINILLAQTINTCTAKGLKLPICQLYTAISLKDNVRLKESYYMAEIRAIKRILDSAGEERQVVCMVDEVLKGTNTVERIAASTQILRKMSREGILCIAATHDSELTRILEKEYQNYHFEEEMAEGDVHFSYQLKSGSASSSNAIRLLEEMGYGKEVTLGARAMIEEYKIQGEWK